MRLFTVNNKFFKVFLIGFIGTSALNGYAAASSGITYTDIANSDNGITYQRGVSPNNVVLDQIKQMGFISSADAQSRSRAPVKPHGAPGVALFDYDGDGDLDIYATNAVGKANSLYQNQYQQNGQLKFQDVAIEAGVAAMGQDSAGVCFGDIDNDGDRDLLVLGNNGASNILYQNDANGQFTDISHKLGSNQSIKHPTSCSMGDVNADGLLDIVIGNTFDNWFHRLPLVTFDNDELLEANQLFFNKGDNYFEDKSEYAGIQNDKYITWAISLVDYDLDGDLDIITADDQGAKAPADRGGRDDGYIRVYRNNGLGQFADVTQQVGTDRFGAWMGLAFGDFNGDDNMDIFATNTGFYITSFLQPALEFQNDIGDWSSSWFLGQDNGQFVFPGVGEMRDTPFGWGASVMDYDNDGDSDITYHGGVNMGIFVESSNAGAILQNNGKADFTRDKSALQNSTDHLRRNVQGMAVGDLNQDGFMDIVSVSSEDWPASFPLAPLAPEPFLIGSPFDQDAMFWPTFVPVDFTDFSQGFVWSGQETIDGTLSVEISSANDNKWIKTSLLGTAGLLAKGKSNRDGIGAVITAKTAHGDKAMRPVIAGSSYASQDSLGWVFGLGKSASATVDVLWPGGTYNRFYNIQAGEDMVLPEIPCSFKDKSKSLRAYFTCVYLSLHKLKKAGHISYFATYRFMRSALRAYLQEHYSYY